MGIWTLLTILCGFPAYLYCLYFMVHLDESSSWAMAGAMASLFVLVYLVWPMGLGYYMLNVVTDTYFKHRDEIKEQCTPKPSEEVAEQYPESWENAERWSGYDKWAEAGWAQDQATTGDGYNAGMAEDYNAWEGVVPQQYVEDASTVEKAKKEKHEKKEKRKPVSDLALEDDDLEGAIEVGVAPLCEEERKREKEWW